MNVCKNTITLSRKEKIVCTITEIGNKQLIIKSFTWRRRNEGSLNPIYLKSFKMIPIQTKFKVNKKLFTQSTVNNVGSVSQTNITLDKNQVNLKVYTSSCKLIF